MSKIYEQNGYRFFFYSAEGDEPCHIHIERDDGDGKAWLEPELKDEYFVDFESQQKGRLQKLYRNSATILFNDGINTSKTKFDPIDHIIFEEGLRIQRFFFDLDIDLMLVVLTNKTIIKESISKFKLLRDANLEQLSGLTYFF